MSDKCPEIVSALRQLKELQMLSHAVTTCVQDCNGEPGNGWKPNLKEANSLIRLMYWKTVRVSDLLQGKPTDATDAEIALAEEALVR